MISLFKYLIPKKKETPKEPESEMGFLDHLEVLRWHIMRAVLAVVVAAIAVFMAKDFVFQDIIFAPKRPDFATYKFFCSLGEAFCFTPPPLELKAIELGEQFFVHLKVSMWLGFTFAFPYVFWEFWSFVKPGLYPAERKSARGLVFVCSLLFVMGVLFGFYVISPFAITWLGGYSVGPDAINSPSLASYVSYLTMFTIPAGLIFELPIFIYFLAKIGFVTPAFLKAYRRHAIILILIVAAIITPPDVVTQMLIAIPVLILYEIGILVAARVEKNEKLKEKEEENA